MNKTMRRLALLAILVALALALYAFWSFRQRDVQLPSTPEETPAAVTPPVARHPIEAVQPGTQGEAPPLPSLDDSAPAVEAALQGLIGQQAVLDFLGVGNPVRQLVATVDNLPRNKAPSRVWPVKRTPGQFTVDESVDGQATISATNSARYTPFVDLVTSVDTGSAVALYVRFYPLLQQAYEGLGYRGKYFNDRVVEVIDNLLATPLAGDEVAVMLPSHDPSIVVEQPWVMYQFADPELESLSAGQKILIRVGRENSARLRTTLQELRQRLATGPPG